MNEINTKFRKYREICKADKLLKINQNYEIEYKIIAQTPILNPIIKDGNYIIPASSLKGGVRHVFQQKIVILS